MHMNASIGQAMTTLSSANSSIRLDKQVREKLTEMAKRRDRSVNYLVSAAVKKMVSDDEKLLQIVNEGITQLDAGMGISHSEMMRRSQAIIDRAKAKKAL